MPIRKIDGREFEQLVSAGQGLVLVDFFADWCGPCRAVAPLLERFADQRAAELRFYKVDSDAESDLSEDLNVRTLPTVIAFRDGIEIGRAIYPLSRFRLEEIAGLEEVD